MKNSDSQLFLEKYVRRIRTQWQIVVFFSTAAYVLSLLHRFYAPSIPTALAFSRTFDTISFVVAIGLAIAILRLKRKYFSLRYFEAELKKILTASPGASETELLRKLGEQLRPKILLVWWLGGGLILLGVAYYWFTFASRNMHIYFIVGLYSLMMNYPRKDLFFDIPFLIKEVLKEKEPEKSEK